eukprot:TRINITY_DN12135_c0_g1_i6.p2 TRINITY_DN12135_c0_g1~~TRINITY_DN12135_c0_g1_i6.p2  ORF type:complete len:152 (+),score=3.17 TRINITY_DN12135_c0_g1_i6:413-868(+)
MHINQNHLKARFFYLKIPLEMLKQTGKKVDLHKNEEKKKLKLVCQKILRSLAKCHSHRKKLKQKIQKYASTPLLQKQKRKILHSFNSGKNKNKKPILQYFLKTFSTKTLLRKSINHFNLILLVIFSIYLLSEFHEQNETMSQMKTTKTHLF